jgi:hypothetical protein
MAKGYLPSGSGWAMVVPFFISIPAGLAAILLLIFTIYDWRLKSTLLITTQLINALAPCLALGLFYSGSLYRVPETMFSISLYLGITLSLIIITVVTISLFIWIRLVNWESRH